VVQAMSTRQAAATTSRDARRPRVAVPRSETRSVRRRAPQRITPRLASVRAHSRAIEPAAPGSSRRALSPRGCRWASRRSVARHRSATRTASRCSRLRQLRSTRRARSCRVATISGDDLYQRVGEVACGLHLPRFVNTFYTTSVEALRTFDLDYGGRRRCNGVTPRECRRPLITVKHHDIGWIQCVDLMTRLSHPSSRRR
jgi:hypothetical protein